MDLDNFIIGKTKERKGEGRFGKKKQQLLSKHRAAGDDKNSQKTVILHLWLTIMANNSNSSAS